MGTCVVEHVNHAHAHHNSSQDNRLAFAQVKALKFGESTRQANSPEAADLAMV